MIITAIRSAARLALLAGLTLGFTSVMAEVLYKLVDKNGKVTYSQSVPANFAGQVVRLEIASTTNTAQSAPRGTEDSGVRTATENEKIIRRRPPSNDDAIEAARLRVQAAQAALADARDNPKPEDWQNTVTGRRYPKPEYGARLERLEQAVKVAEEALHTLERAL
jgi:Domain of unknown function (DUF4124)